ncbi:hypothetical protein SLA2020_143650 [Shorea laevis]
MVAIDASATIVDFQRLWVTHKAEIQKKTGYIVMRAKGHEYRLLTEITPKSIAVHNPTEVARFVDLIETALEIKDTHVREAITPLVNVVAIDASATLVDFHHLWVTHEYSRQCVDNIVGIAYAMDLLDFVRKARQFLPSTHPFFHH